MKKNRFLFWVVLLILPASALAQSRLLLGSVQTHGGLIRINGIIAPAQAKLFGGDRIETNNGQAVVDYKNGTRVVLASESIANCAREQVQLERGFMAFKTRPDQGMFFMASTLRLNPIGSPQTGANVTFNDSRISIVVTSGAINVVDPSGEHLASLDEGHARLFEETPAPTSTASAFPPSIKERRRHHKHLISRTVRKMGQTVCNLAQDVF